MVDEVREDEPVLADDLRVEAIELFREVNERVRDANEMLQHQEGEALFCANALGRTAPNA